MWRNGTKKIYFYYQDYVKYTCIKKKPDQLQVTKKWVEELEFFSSGNYRVVRVVPVSLTDPERVIVPPLLSLLILHIFYQSSNLLILVKSLDFQQPASITVIEQSKCQLQTISEFMHTPSNSNCTCKHISRKSYIMHVLK